tara:strand:+ start:1148 stop:1597 length:450 start_codon:yes stop_codon:yes gene_type:complete
MNGKKTKIMGIFSSSSKKQINQPEEMSPLEAVTHLFAAIQIADQQASYEEKESWINAISKLFPENSSERSEKYYSQAHKALSLQNNEQRLAYIQSTLKRIKALLSEDQIDSIGPMIADIVEADGIVMTSEMDIVSLAEKTLDIKIEIEE